MKLYKDGITRNTDNPNIIADLKKAGYEPVEKTGSKAEKEAAKKAEEDALKAAETAKKEGE